MRNVLQYGYFPLMLIGFNSAIIFLNGNNYPWYATLPLMGLALIGVPGRSRQILHKHSGALAT